MVNLTRRILPGIARMIPVVHSEVNGGFNKWWQCARSVCDGQLEADARCALHTSGEDRQARTPLLMNKSASGTITAYRLTRRFLRCTIAAPAATMAGIVGSRSLERIDGSTF